MRHDHRNPEDIKLTVRERQHDEKLLAKIIAGAAAPHGKLKHKLKIAARGWGAWPAYGKPQHAQLHR